MADVRVNLQARNLLADLKKIQAALLGVKDAERQQIDATVKLNKSGNILSATLRRIGNENERVRISLRKVKGEFRAVAVSTDKAANAQDRSRARIAKAREETRKLRLETERLKKIQIEATVAAKRFAVAQAQIQARRTTESLQRGAFGPGGQTAALGRGVTQIELFNFQNELGKLADLQTRHRLTSKQVLAQWRVVAAGRINAETGVRRKVQAQLLRIQESHRALGREARNSQARIAQRTEETTNAIKRGTKAADGFRLSWRNLIRIAAISLGLRAINAFIGAIREGITAAKEFSISVAEVQTIDRANVSTQEWTASLRELSDSFGIDIVDQAEAAYQALSNQVVTGADATEFLAAANRLAITAVTDTSTAVNLLTAAINAFGLEASTVEEISAKFFKTVELGRLRIEDISGVFGRVAVPASQLGITLDELSAGFAALTIQGIKAEEASTLIRNIVLKLIRPTDALKETFADLGVESGKAAVETFGFGGLLIKLIDSTGGSVTKLGELFGRIRAISGVLGFAKDGLVTYNKALIEIGKSSETFAERTDIITRSAGFELRKALNEVANIFKVDIGQASLEAIRDLTGGFKGLVDATKVLLQVLKFLAGATIPLLTVGIALLITKIIALSGALITLAVKNPFTAFLVIIGLVISAINKLIQAQQRAVEASAQAVIAELDSIKKLEAEERASFNRRIQQQKDFLRRSSQATRIAAANLIGSINKQSKAFAATFKAVSKALKDDFKNLTDFAKNQVSEAEKAFDKTNERIKSLREDIRTAFESEGRAVFDLRFNVLDDPEAQIKLISQRIKELREQSQQVTDIKLFNALRKEVQALAKQRGEILTQNVKEAQQQEAINAFAKDFNSILKEGVSLREKLLGLQNKQLENERISKEQAEDVAKRLAEAVKTFTGFDPAALARTRIEAGDDPKTVLKTLKDRFKAQTAAGQEIFRINAARGDSAVELIGLAKLLTKIEIEGAEVVKSIRTKFLVEQLNAARQANDESLENIKKEQELIKAGVGAFKIQLGDVVKLLADPAAVSTFLSGRVSEADRFLGIRSGILTENARLEARKDLLSVAKVFTDFIKVVDEGDVQKIDKSFKRVVTAFEFLGSAAANQDLKGFTEAQLNSIKLITDTAKDFFDLVAKNEFQSSKQLETRIKQALKANTEIAKEIAKLGGEELSNQARVNEVLATAEGNLKDFNTALEKLVKFLKNNPLTPTGVPGGSRGGFVNRFQKGGFVPTGTDTIPAMLTPGEFVMNAAATRKFAAQLVSMNSNIQPQRFQQGGPVNNNNITLNVSVDGATQSPDQMAVEIGQALKRQIRRGVLSLN